jgi:hypothetical protein
MTSAARCLITVPRYNMPLASPKRIIVSPTSPQRFHYLPSFLLAKPELSAPRANVKM